MKIFSRHVSAQLAAYIDGELGSEEAQRIKNHLARCEHCQQERNLTQSGMAVLDHLPSVHAPDSIWTDIEAAILAARPVQRQSSRQWQLALAMLAILSLAIIVSWNLYRREAQWELVRIHGTPVVDARPVHDVLRIGAGEWIETNSSSSATVNLGKIGSVEIAPSTRLLIVTARRSQNRLLLKRGQIHAKISAPPKLFLVDTAAGTAVDLGCEYSLHTDERGLGLLQVTQGWVSFQWKGIESLVPAGASCRTRPQAGPGAPYFDDASASFKEALEDFASAGFKGTWLYSILADARVRDTLTLWHLLSRVEFHDREQIYARVAALTPVPAGVSREKALSLDPETLARWRDELAWTW
jgi:putative zinc finger protein/FecR-like protein